MKKIVILLITLLGICKVFTQIPSASNMPDSIKNTLAAAQQTVKDSLLNGKKATAKLYPNPAKNKAIIEVEGFDRGRVQLQLIDITGKIVRNDERLLISGNEPITLMFSLPNGIYFIVLRQGKKLVKMKMVVQ
jgi:Secretion system C-terminal sorting domain